MRKNTKISAKRMKEIILIVQDYKIQDMNLKFAFPGGAASSGGQFASLDFVGYSGKAGGAGLLAGLEDVLGVQEGLVGDLGLRFQHFDSPTLDVGKAAAFPVGAPDSGEIADLDRDPGSKVGMEGGCGLQVGGVDVQGLWSEPLGLRSLASECIETFPAATFDSKVTAGLEVGHGLISGQGGGHGSWGKSMGHQPLVVEFENVSFPIGLGNAKVLEVEGFSIQKRYRNLMHSMGADVNGMPHSLAVVVNVTPHSLGATFGVEVVGNSSVAVSETSPPLEGLTGTMGGHGSLAFLGGGYGLKEGQKGGHGMLIGLFGGRGSRLKPKGHRFEIVGSEVGSLSMALGIANRAEVEQPILQTRLGNLGNLIAEHTKEGSHSMGHRKLLRVGTEVSPLLMNSMVVEIKGAARPKKFGNLMATGTEGSTLQMSLGRSTYVEFEGSFFSKTPKNCYLISANVAFNAEGHKPFMATIPNDAQVLISPTNSTIAPNKRANDTD